MDSPSPPYGFETRAIHAGQDPDPVTGSVVPAVHLATTYRQRAVGGEQKYEYARSANPTRASLEEQMASLEGADYGYAFASGLAAEDAVLRALVASGDHMILPLDAYGGTFRLVESVHQPAGIEYSTTEVGDTELLGAVWRDETRLVWVETPSNPSLSIIDIAATAAYVHERGALLVVDNTFATPYLQNPLALGADVVVHSSTKYLGGHSDVVGGLAVLNDADVAARIAFLQNATGAVPGPWDSYLIQRGAKTLALRMERHCLNAQAVADFLDSHDSVATTYYPGLVSHPGHDIAERQMRGFGGIVSFLHAGGETEALAMVARTHLFTLAESLGAVESLIEHPGRMTHAVLAESSLAVDPRLIRLSVGIENVDDLLTDLDHAFRG
ncbi:MAG TPA: cystathionine gamma-synthase [Acidimicrobiales bacterium]|jgi:cystathionine gamma-synthase